MDRTTPDAQERARVRALLERQKNMDVTKKYPYVRASNVVLSEETFQEVSTNPYWVKTVSERFTAAYSGHPDDGSVGLKNYGPRLEMTRSGTTAVEAFKNLVEALEEQGFTVRID
jgi:hypothetical protein